jgi:Phage integrase family
MPSLRPAPNSLSNAIPGDGGRKGNLGRLKTKAARRAVPLPPIVLREIRAQLLHRPARTGFVFPAPKGGPWDRTELSRRFKKWTDNAELAGVVFHDLRHTFASLAIKAGAHPKVLQELMAQETATATTSSSSCSPPLASQRQPKGRDPRPAPGLPRRAQCAHPTPRPPYATARRPADRSGDPPHRSKPTHRRTRRPKQTRHRRIAAKPPTKNRPRQARSRLTGLMNRPNACCSYRFPGPSEKTLASRGQGANVSQSTTERAVASSDAEPVSSFKTSRSPQSVRNSA